MCGRTAWPVLVSSQHYRGELESLSERVVQPMKWGLVPGWHKGDPYKLQYETNNCRAEGMLTKRTYKTPLEKGNRCVVLADGFFEWKRGSEGKQPYFIYFPPKSPVSPADGNPDPCLHTDKPDLDRDSTAKPPLKRELVDPKPDPLKPGLKSSVDSRVKQEPVDLKPDPDAESSASTRIKQEPVDFKPDPDAKSSASTRIKQEPVDFKPDADTVLKGVQKEEGDAVCSSSTDHGSASSRNSAKKEGCGEKDSSQCQPASTAKGTTDHIAHAEDGEWQGKRLLTMAGVFDVWQPPDGSPPLYSYSVITVEASPTMAGIHNRMPAILSTEEEINAWLDFAHIPLTQAVKVIHPTEAVSMHMVSPVVNNSRNKSPDCVEVYNPKQVKKTASSNLMMNWLKKAAPSAHPDPPSSKKQKLA